MMRPQDLPGVGGQGIDRVVLSGGKDRSREDQRLTVELTVKGRRIPCRNGRREGVARRIDPRAQGVVIEGRPIRCGHRQGSQPGR
jgi:hypothetical protein